MYSLQCAVWETTLKCNMNCSHCGSRAGKARADELTTQECFDLIEQLAELDCDMVSLMGGEPFVRPDWYDLARCVKDLGMKLAWVSNGLLIPKYLPKIVHLAPTVVGISLDGLEMTHDAIRRPGSFKVTLEAIDLLHQQGIQVTVITTVSKLNIADLPSLSELLHPKNINWQIQIANPFGNFDRKLLISENQYYEVAEFILKRNNKPEFRNMPIVGGHDLGYYSKKYPKRTEWFGCTAGKSTLGITSNGNIVGCLSLGNDRFFEGNIRKQSLRDIWEDPSTFKFTRQFKQSSLGPNCKGCDYWKQCQGGCSATSYTITNRFHNMPYCMRRIESKREKKLTQITQK